MAHTLSNHNGVQIVTPDNDLTADRQALNDNFEYLADHAFIAGASVSDTHGDSLTVCNGTDAITTVGPASLDNGAITTDGSGDLTVKGFNCGTVLFLTGNLVDTSPGAELNGPLLPFDVVEWTFTVYNVVYTLSYNSGQWQILGGSGLLALGPTTAGNPAGAYTHSLVSTGSGTLTFQPTLEVNTVGAFTCSATNLVLRSVITAYSGAFGKGLTRTYIGMQSDNYPVGLDSTDNASNETLLCDGTWAINVLSGPTQLDGGGITTDGLGTLCLHPQSSPPAAVAGGIYFDGTNFNFCSDGSTWVALTLP
jgi:hypothetical protein